MKSVARRNQCDYFLTFILDVVDQIERGELTYKQAQDKYGIQGCFTALVWLRKHGRLDWSGYLPRFLKKGLPMFESNSLPTREQRIKDLEKQLEDTKLRADFFEEVVKVME